MVEGQSRYGIMEELNNRKINEKEKLANIERETDAKIYETEKQIIATENKVLLFSPGSSSPDLTGISEFFITSYY